MGRNLHVIATMIIATLGLVACAAMQSGTTPDAKLGPVQTKGPVGKTFQTNQQKFVNCARDAVSIQTGTTQTLDLHFDVDGEGKVVKATVASMTMGDPDLHDCVLAKLRQVRFPKPKDGTLKHLRYALVLKPN